MRSFETKPIRKVGATVFLGLLGSLVALLPIVFFTFWNQGAALHWSVYEGASILAGVVIGWVLRR
ncbi:hypothetical protein [Candidatus Phycosocius spiralis]|uniref:Uncharacterized protein n=1 Tax=Candidatus Phycosocius spiralis TaxID=2815099 RepID=A0ABQ4PXC6_9PROT|nr:hypothetical protein [Candidatus Phycosocius spiralis]GIU67338.1 hypothetical protein PsB1_1492 [Candidatus Phycosocius spiralis]